MDPLSIAGSIGGSLVSGIMGQRAADQSWDRQKSMFRKEKTYADKVRAETMHFNRAERLGAEAFTADQWRRNALWTAGRENEAWRRQGSQLQRMAADAKAAGLHPLAAIGGAATYAPVVSSGAAASSPGFAGVSPDGSPGFSDPAGGGNPWGDAILQGLDMFSRLRSDAAEREVMKSQIRANDAQAAAMVADATSRTIAANARSGATGGPAGTGAPSRATGSDKEWWVPEGHENDQEPARATPGLHKVVFPGGFTGWGLSEDGFSSELAQTIGDAAKVLTLAGGAAWKGGKAAKKAYQENVIDAEDPTWTAPPSMGMEGVMPW